MNLNNKQVNDNFKIMKIKNTIKSYLSIDFQMNYH